MRAVLCTSGGPGALVLETLSRSADIEIVGVVRSTRIGAWQRYRASGLRYALYLGCHFLRSFRARGLPLLATRNANDAAGRAFVERLAPDLLVSAFFNQRIGEALAALPRVAALNIHPSLLPAFKGVDPVFQARLAGAAPLGVTLHRISPQLDSGDVVSQRTLDCRDEESVLRVTERLYAEGARLLVESLPAIGKATPQSGSGSYDSWPSRAQVAALRAKGVRLVRLGDLLARPA